MEGKIKLIGKNDTILVFFFVIRPSKIYVSWTTIKIRGCFDLNTAAVFFAACFSETVLRILTETVTSSNERLF